MDNDQVFGTRLFFGEPWDASAVDYARRADTPVAQTCLHCGQDIVEGDRGWYTAVLGGDGATRPAYTHAECEILGIAGHTYGVCSCHGYGHDRAAAQLLWERIGQRRGRPMESLSGLSWWRQNDAGEWFNRYHDTES